MDRTEINNLNVRELKHELAQLNLPTTGNKAELRKRLCSHLQILNETIQNEDSANNTIETVYEDATNAVQKLKLEETQRSRFTLKDIQESISYFDGNSQPDIESWVEEFEDNARIVEWNEVQKFIYAKQLIKGAARIFVRSQATIHDWQELKNVLLHEFGEKFTAIDIHKQLQSRRKYYRESYIEYLYTLMEIGSKVNLDDRSIMDYFIDGINDSKFNKYILYDAKDMNDFKQKIKAYEKMKTQTNKYDNRHTPGFDNTYKKYENNKGTKFNNNRNNSDSDRPKQYIEYNKRCTNCPHLRNHTSEECWKNMCFKCKKKGHKSYECRESSQNQHNTRQKSYTDEKRGKENNSNMLEFPHNDEYVLNVRDSVSKVRIPVTIKDVNFLALFDTGSDISVMKKETFDKLGGLILFPQKINLNGIGQGSLTTMGYTIVNAKLKNIELNMIFHIVKDDDLLETALIGSDVLNKADVHITASGPTFILKEEQEPLEDILFNHILGSKSDVDKNFTVGKVFSSICKDNSIEINSGLDMDHLDKATQYKLSNLIKNYKTEKTKSPQIQMKIVLTDDVPVYHRPRRFPLVEQKIIEKQINEWLQAGIVKQSNSEYASQVLLVAKKDGSKRLCCDFRKINTKIIRDNFPMVLIDDVLAKLQNAKVYTTLDLKNGFFHVPISPESQKYTAIVTQQGQYEFTKAPFGMTNSPAAFCRYITAIFNELISNNTVIIYMDDLVIPSQTIEENMEKLNIVLKVASEHGIELNWKKSQFVKQEINFLGYIIKDSSIKPSLEKVKAVTNFPCPKDIKTVQQFLGLTSYFRRFIPKYAAIAKPLSDLLSKNKKFKIEDEEIVAFEQLKQCLMNAPILQIFNPCAQTEVHTDASMHGFGAALMQKNSEDGKWHPVEYMSKKTSELEKKFHSYELEVLAIVNALKKWRTHLLGIHFRIITDCNAFTQTVKKVDMPARISRWVIFLQEFDFEIEHRAGSRLKHVDALSRVYSYLMQNPMMYKIRQAQEQDSWTKTIIDLLEKQRHQDFFMKNNMLYKDQEKELLVIPESMEQEIIEMAHRKGHISAKKTTEIVNKDFYIRNITEKTNKIVKSCIPCIVSESKSGKKESFLNPIDKADRPLHTLHIDHLGPLENTHKQYNYIFSIVDAFSKYIWLFPTKSTGTQEVINALEKQATVFGNPCRIISDRGSAFMATAFKEYCEEQNIKHYLITTGVPRGNGQIERMHKIVISLLTKLCAEKPQNWYKYLNRIQQTINSTVSRATKSSPFRILTGLEMKIPGIDEIRNLLEEEELKELEEERERIRKEAKENILKIAEENKKSFNKNRKKEEEYEVGDIVAIKRTQFGTGLKIKPKFLGPYKVVKRKGNSRYEVEKIGEVEGPNKTTTMAENMKKWK